MNTHPSSAKPETSASRSPDALKEAQTQLQQAQRDLEQAQLDLRYCTIVAEIDGVITRHDVNPGNHVQVGQNFRWSCIIIFCTFGVLYANTTTLPALLQSLFGYDATTSGLVLSPSGVAAVTVLVVVGTLLSRGVDARYFMVAGVITMGLGNFWTSRPTLDVGPWQVVRPHVVVIAGLSMVFAPLNIAGFRHLPKELRAAAVGLLVLLRNEGGSVGTSIARTIHDSRDPFHSLRLGENLDKLNPAVKPSDLPMKAGFKNQQNDGCRTSDSGPFEFWQETHFGRDATLG
jgi:MFS transporter